MTKTCYHCGITIMVLLLLESYSDTNSDDPVMLLYATICDITKPVLGDTKIPFAVKKEAQGISNTLEGRLA